MTTDIYKKSTLIFGCGNTLFGNDGFGPEVINHLHTHHTFPDSVLALDAGTGIRDFIFDLLLIDQKPELVIIIDAVTIDGRTPGEVFEIDLSCVPKQKMADFSLHQSPSSNLLSQLKDTGVDVKMLGMQTDFIPNEISPGLCPKTQAAVPAAAEWIIRKTNSREGYKENRGN